ncbi:hypothetical protein PD5205_03167 [Xanthomonas fragariae]|nr:hypothetical protein PD5205_03167 [Xanthomonas fragariae]
MRTGRLPANALRAAPARPINRYAPRWAFSALNAMACSYPFSRNLQRAGAGAFASGQPRTRRAPARPAAAAKRGLRPGGRALRAPVVRLGRVGGRRTLCPLHATQEDVEFACSPIPGSCPRRTRQDRELSPCAAQQPVRNVVVDRRTCNVQSPSRRSDALSGAVPESRRATNVCCRSVSACVGATAPQPHAATRVRATHAPRAVNWAGTSAISGWRAWSSTFFGFITLRIPPCAHFPPRARGASE